MKSTLDILIEARAYVEKGWTQGAWARNRKGTPVNEDSTRAVCWCALGALWKADGIGSYGLNALVKASGGEVHPTTISGWNDNPDRTQAEVLALFDKAIEAERAKA